MNEKTQIIGRSQSADFIIPSSRVSRRHCSIIVSGDGFVLQDHDSKNGVWVEGRRVKSAYLNRGSRFSVAEYSVRISGDGSLVLEGKVDPKRMLIRDKIRDGIPALATLMVILILAAVPFFLESSKPTEETISSNSSPPEEITLWAPKKEEDGGDAATVVEPGEEDGIKNSVEEENQKSPIEADEISGTWSTSSGREWTLEELLALAEAIEKTDVPRGESGISDSSESVVPALDPAEIVIPTAPDPWVEVARLRKEGRNRRRRARISDAESTGGDASTTEVVTQNTVAELLEMGRAAISNYHVPDDVMPQLLFALDSLRDMRNEEAWQALDTLRRESRDLLKSVAARARQIGQKYGHLDRNPDAPLSPKDRREAELALNLLVLIQEQMEILLKARDAAFGVLANPADPEMLAFALSVALEDDNDELLNLVLSVGVAQGSTELLPVLIRGLKIPSATRKLKVREALQKITGESFHSVSEWERWLKSREGNSP